MLKPLDVANYFLSLKKYSDLTNLKLQKILYYAHGHHLALYNKPLFNAKIEAWEFGPVFPELYGKLKKYKSRAIRAPEKFDMKILGDKAEFLNQILDMYGSYSASKLCDLSHEKSSPWDVVFNNNDDNNLLNDHLMKVYFTEIVKLSSKNSDPFKVAKTLKYDSSLKETMHILSNPLNADKLMKALEESEKGQTFTLDWRNVN